MVSETTVCMAVKLTVLQLISMFEIELTLGYLRVEVARIRLVACKICSDPRGAGLALMGRHNDRDKLRATTGRL